MTDAQRVSIMIRGSIHETKRSDMISKNLTVVLDKIILSRYDKKSRWNDGSDKIQT